MYGRPFTDADYRLIPNESFSVAWTATDRLFNPAFAPGSLAEQPQPAQAASGASTPLGATTSNALGANPRRACLIIQNNSATGGPVLWFAFGVKAVANQCFALQPGGSLVIANPDACPKEAVNTVGAGSGTLIACIYESTLPSDARVDAAAPGVNAAIAWGYTPPPSTPPAPAAVVARPYAGFVTHPVN